MLANHDEFSATVKEAGKPNWGELAKVFAAEGLRDLRNQPPSAEGARQTWFKVRQAVAKAAAAPTQTRPPRVVTPPLQREPDERPVSPGPRFAFNNEATDDDLTRLTGVKPKPR
jgi:hypothetical protein